MKKANGDKGIKIMATTVYNPQKGRLETIDVVYTKENTTWFDNDKNTRDIAMITVLMGVYCFKQVITRIRSGSTMRRGRISAMTRKKHNSSEIGTNSAGL